MAVSDEGVGAAGDFGGVFFDGGEPDEAEEGPGEGEEDGEDESRGLEE